MSSMRDMFVGIYFRDEATRVLQNLDRQMDAVEDAVTGVGRRLGISERNINRFGNVGLSATRDVERGFEDADDGAREFYNGVNKAINGVHSLKKTMKNMVGIVAGVFAVDKIKEFGLSAIETAANFKAMDAQFEQVFKGMESESANSLNAIAEKTGMIPERLKGSFTKIAAFAKTTGVDTASALGLTERATLAAADSAAFYDRSIEEVAENLQSFLKGNYENDAALGISATEFTRNTAAMAKFGKKFNDLTEYQKQDTLMQMVEDGNKLTGALNQAANEADAYENQIGNMKMAWTKFKAKIGGPLLQPFVDSMQSASQWMENLDTDKLVSKIDRVVGFVGTVKETIMSLVYDTGEVSDLWQNFGFPKETSDQIASFADTMKNTVVGGIDIAVTAFNGFKTGVSWVIDNKELVIAGLAGIAGGFAALKAITFVKTALDLYKNSTIVSTIATQGFNGALKANPIGMVVTAVGLLVAGGVALYRNWDTVKTKAVALWQVIDNNPILSFLSGPIGLLIKAGVTIYKNWDKITNNFNKFKNAITNFKVPEWVSSIGSTIGKAAGAVGNFISGSHATGLERVPYDGYVAELHKDESVLTASQSNTLRRAGILSQGSSGTPELNLDNNSSSTSSIPQPLSSGNSTTNNSGGNQFIFQISGNNPIDIAKEVRAVISDIVDTEMQTI
ncbi:hypothetical protein ACIQXW_15365 [Lysinibacillus sp. NPDC097162]|uniref:hypothetical protein n=1 Tax=Lysinibacillus sp. NPDC097162 TaxID=3364140 RepID=UPI0038002E72